MATGKEIRNRVFAMSGAILFFVTSIALTVIVIVQIAQDNKNKSATTTATSQVGKDNKLQGTKLKDFEPVKNVAEVQVTDLKVGDGKEVTAVENKVTTDYTGALAADGKIFQSSLDSGQRFTTTLDGVIKGWQTGMIGMKEGGTRRILIPAAEGYGSQASGDIPANSDLVFEVTLYKVE